MTFVDTSGWYALFVRKDQYHVRAKLWYSCNADDLVTTDDIVNETLNLMNSRGHRAQAYEFGEAIFADTLADTINLDYLIRDHAWHLFRTFTDKAWSFTDCTSFAFMESQGIDTAFAFDAHFHQYGKFIVVPQ